MRHQGSAVTIAPIAILGATGLLRVPGREDRRDANDLLAGLAMVPDQEGQHRLNTPDAKETWTSV